MDYRTFYRSQFLALAAFVSPSCRHTRRIQLTICSHGSLALLLGVFYPTVTWKKVAWMSLFSTNYISQLDSVVAQERFKWLGVAALVSCLPQVSFCESSWN